MCSSMSALDRVRPATLRISHARPADLPRSSHPGPVRADRGRVLAQRPPAARSGPRSSPTPSPASRARRPTSTRGPRAYPARRAGDSGDAALGAQLAAAFRAMGSYQVSTPSFEAETADGKRRLTTVIARQVGQPGPGLVVVAHRDALGRGARAELSGTAAMLELARVVRGGRLKRTVTFVSTSGGSAGLGGARDLAQRLGGRPGAVLVLGDLAGTTVRRPFVAGWSTGDGVGALQLRRTVEAAVRKEAGTNPGGARATSQWARLAFPVTIGEQGPLVAADLPAALHVGRRRAPAAGRRPDRARAALQAFGRAALRTLTALDNTPTLGTRRLEPRPGHDAQGPARCGPCGCSSPPCCWRRCWSPSTASRACAAATSRSARGCGGSSRPRRRWRSRWPSPGCWASPGCCPATPPEPVAAGRDPGRDRGDGGARGRRAGGAPGLDRAAARAAAQGRRAHRDASSGEGAGAALLVTWCAAGRRAVGAQPLRRGAARARRARAARRRRPRGAPAPRPRGGPRRGRRRARSCSSTCRSPASSGCRRRTSAGSACCSSPAASSGRWAGSSGASCSPAWSPRCSWRCAAGRAWRRRRPPQITVRGPVSYAGPGSLGGTESALRR